MQTLQGMAAVGRISPFAMWSAMAVFSTISAGLFWRAQRHPGENPLDPMYVSIELGIAWVRAAVRVIWRKVRPT